MRTGSTIWASRRQRRPAVHQPRPFGDRHGGQKWLRIHVSRPLAHQIRVSRPARRSPRPRRSTSRSPRRPRPIRPVFASSARTKNQTLFEDADTSPSAVAFDASPAVTRPTARSSSSPREPSQSARLFWRAADNTRGMLAIRTENLTKDFRIGFWRPRPYRALDHLNLEVAQGETFGFLGPNGAGKTTTLKLLMQLIFPTSGRAEILGQPGRRYRGQAPHRLPSREPLLLRLPHRGRASGLFRQPDRLRPRRADAGACRRCSTKSALPANAGCSSGSSRRACCSVWASRRRCSTIRRWCFSTSRCRASIPSAGARCAI